LHDAWSDPGRSQENGQGRIAGYIESLKKHKAPIPSDDDLLVASPDVESAETSRR
jgi:hypothetical protein